MIIDRYVLKEILYTLLAVLVVLLIIFLSNRLVRFLADASTGKLASDIILAMLAMKTVSALVIILPLGLFMSVLLVFSRMYKDSEMTALAACGVSTRRIYRPVMVLAALVAVTVGWISLYIAPWAEEEGYRMRDEQRARSELIGIAPGRFTESDRADGVLYVEKLSDNGRTMHNVFIQGYRSQGQLILSAERGFQRRDESGEQFLMLANGYRYEGVPGGADFRIIRFREHAVRLDQEEVDPAFRKQRALPTNELLGSDEVADVAELQWRVSMPLSVLFLALLAVPLSRTSPRQGKYAKLFVAVLVYLIYNNMLGVANTWVARGILPPEVGMWWVHLGMLVATWLLFVRHYGLAWAARVVAGRGAHT